MWVRGVCDVQVIPFSKREILGAIHQSYRIQYFKVVLSRHAHNQEVVLTNIVDDYLINSVSSLLSLNNSKIVEMVKESVLLDHIVAPLYLG